MTWPMQPVCSPVLAQPITSFLLSQLPVWPIFLAHTIEVLLIGWWISFSVLEHRSLNLIWFKVMETLSQLSYSSGCSCLLVSGCYRRAPRSWTHSWPFREDECDHFHFMCWFQELYDRTSLQWWTVIYMVCCLNWNHLLSSLCDIFLFWNHPLSCLSVACIIWTSSCSPSSHLQRLLQPALSREQVQLAGTFQTLHGCPVAT